MGVIGIDAVSIIPGVVVYDKKNNHMGDRLVSVI